MRDRIPEDRNCRFSEYMFVVDNLTTRRAGTLHKALPSALFGIVLKRHNNL